MINYAIVYNGGFSIAWTPEMAGNVIAGVANVRLFPENTAELAYLRGAREFFKREYFGYPGIRQPVMPRFETIQQQSFLRPDVIPQISVERHFAAVCGEAAGYLRGASAIVGFLQAYPRAIVIETAGYYEALKVANYYNLRKVMPFGAYLDGEDIPMIRELPSDEICETNFSAWWKSHRAAVPAQLAPSQPLQQIYDIVPVEQRRKNDGNNV